MTSNIEQVNHKLDLIESYPFQQARRELGILQHWVVFVDFQQLPERDTVVDRFYDQVDQNKATAIVEL